MPNVPRIDAQEVITNALLVDYSRLYHALSRGRVAGDPADLLEHTLAQFLATGWKTIPEPLLSALNDIPQEERERIRSTMQRILGSVHYAWQHSAEWREAGPEKALESVMPALMARAGTCFMASRLLDHDRSALELEARIMGEMLKVAGVYGRIRDAIRAHGVSIRDAAPAVYAAASAVVHESEGIPEHVTLGGTTLKVHSPELYVAVVEASQDYEIEVSAYTNRAIEQVLKVTELPDLGTVASFEESALGIDRKHAVERIIESVYAAQRERRGKTRDSIAERMGTQGADLVPALRAISEQVKWGQAQHSVYNRAWKYVIAERIKLEELEERKRDKRNPGPPVKVIHPIPLEFDGVSAFGLYLLDGTKQGDPLSLAWSQIADWGELPADGGFVFSADEQQELANVCLYSALGYAAAFAVDNDKNVERLVKASGLGFLRERLREIEMQLRHTSHLGDEDLAAFGEREIIKLAESPGSRGIRKQDMTKHMEVIGHMIDRVRAHAEVRRLIAHRAISGTIPPDLLKDIPRLPHGRRHSLKATRHPLWWQETFTGQSRLDLLNDVMARAADYRRAAPDYTLNVRAFNNPTDRWEGADQHNDLRKIGFQAPRINHRIASDAIGRIAPTEQVHTPAKTFNRRG